MYKHHDFHKNTINIKIFFIFKVTITNGYQIHFIVRKIVVVAIEAQTENQI